ncbi:MAG: lysylphosphatidylglycerol synthase transmembrane domain-containing protein [bacterium]|nr:lysylphosphatidylglycerol synthase transmembrane domain-containing protein [bacterium]
MKKYYRIITVSLSLLLLWFLLAQMSFGDIMTLARNIRLPYLLAAFAMYGVVNAFRAARFWDLVARRIPLRRMIAITFAHAFVNSVAPARMGEFSYVYYVQRTGKVGLGVNVASLFISRAFDMLLTVAAMLVSVVFVARGLQNAQQLVFLSAAGFIVLLAVFFLFFFWETKVLWAINGLFELLRLKRYAFGSRMLEKVREIISTIAAGREPRLFARTFMWTMLVWAAIYFMLWFIALGLGLAIGFWQSVFMASLPTLASTLPFYTIGNFGLFEGAKTLALTLLGFGRELAISFSFLSHIAEIVMFAIPGIPAYLFLAVKKSGEDAQSPT